MSAVYQGLICRSCASKNSLLEPNGCDLEMDTGKCMTCGVTDAVTNVSEYIVPHNVTVIESKSALNLYQELSITKRLFEKQTELYKVACDEIEKLEEEIRLLRFGSKWGGQT